jgi:hypothetical protein
VFGLIDEADQALGKRDCGSNDWGLSGRVDSMVAKEMSDSSNKIVWVLASSRPDLIEIDLKRQAASTSKSRSSLTINGEAPSDRRARLNGMRKNCCAGSPALGVRGFFFEPQATGLRLFRRNSS